MFDIEFFQANPEPFFQLARALLPSRDYRPTLAHYFMRLLHEKKRLLRVYTQNIDGLERRTFSHRYLYFSMLLFQQSFSQIILFLKLLVAGVPSDLLVEAHGSFSTATCIGCRRSYSLEDIRPEIVRGHVPYCRQCPVYLYSSFRFGGCLILALT